MYKLIASDLDETLLDDHHCCPKANVDAILKAKEKYGVKFVPCTGRGFASISPELKATGLYDLPGEYSISFNGGAITENKDSKVISFNGLGYPKMKEIFEQGLHYDVCIHVYTIDKVYVYNINDDEKQRFINQGVDCIIMEENTVDFLEDARIAKILYQNTNVPYLQSLEPKMQELVKDVVEVSYSSNRYMEFNALGVDKGNGILLLAKMLNILPEEIIAVGDNYNDLPMFREVGLSVAANNAVDAVKSVCDYTTKANNNDGVLAEVIAKFIFNEDV